MSTSTAFSRINVSPDGVTLHFRNVDAALAASTCLPERVSPQLIDGGRMTQLRFDFTPGYNAIDYLKSFKAMGSNDATLAVIRQYLEPAVANINAQGLLASLSGGESHAPSASFQQASIARAASSPSASIA